MEVSDKIKSNQPIVGGFEIKKQFTIVLTKESIKNLKQILKKKWEKLFK